MVPSLHEMLEMLATATKETGRLKTQLDSAGEALDSALRERDILREGAVHGEEDRRRIELERRSLEFDLIDDEAGSPGTVFCSVPVGTTGLQVPRYDVYVYGYPPYPLKKLSTYDQSVSTRWYFATLKSILSVSLHNI